MLRLRLIVLAAILLASPAWADGEDINTLFDHLKAAPTAEAAENVATSIKRLWMRSGSDTADLLMERADTAMEHQDFPLAVELLDRLLVLDPDWAEAWNHRATVFYLMDDYRRAMADIGETLKREPRHYGALAGMGLIFLHQGDHKHAFGAFEQVLVIYPQLETAKKAVDQLRPEVEGTSL